jgi:hypothetical protein
MSGHPAIPEQIAEFLHRDGDPCAVSIAPAGREEPNGAVANLGGIGRPDFNVNQAF